VPHQQIVNRFRDSVMTAQSQAGRHGKPCCKRRHGNSGNRQAAGKRRSRLLVPTLTVSRDNKRFTAFSFCLHSSAF
jgi:hypothetical protein